VKALFFLRHYNDVDHIIPIVYKWRANDHSAEIVFIGESDFADDPRVRFVRDRYGVAVAHTRELLPATRWFGLSKAAQLLHRFKPNAATRALRAVWPESNRLELWVEIAETLLNRAFRDQTSGVVAFDWITSKSTLAVEFVEAFARQARKRGLPTVSLPHGDSPHITRLIRNHELTTGPDPKYAAAQFFDAVAVPNEICADRYRPFMPSHRIHPLGSPRYSDEWMARMDELAPEAPNLPNAAGRLRVAVFLRKPDFSIFQAEVGRVVRILTGFDDLHLLIKPHTRHRDTRALRRDFAIKKADNLTVADHSVHSPAILRWADIVVDLATSVAYEAVKRELPLLEADYLHAGLSTPSHFIPETALRCRDDVLDRIDALRSSANRRNFYPPQHREAFLRHVVDVPDKSVLERYVGLLENVGPPA